MSQQVRLRLLPSFRCLFDEPVQLKVSGLRSRQVVTMRARTTDEKGEVFSSSATYIADNNGEIDLNTDPSFSGSYVGIQPMGLLSSLKPDNMHKRFYKNKSVEPFMVNFSVHEDVKILAEATNERFLMADGVRRVHVKEGNMFGVLFIPPGCYVIEIYDHFKTKPHKMSASQDDNPSNNFCSVRSRGQQPKACLTRKDEHADFCPSHNLKEVQIMVMALNNHSRYSCCG